MSRAGRRNAVGRTSRGAARAPGARGSSTSDAPAPLDAAGDGSAWYTTFFDETYGLTDLVPTCAIERERIDRAAAELVALLRLEAGSLVFDQCSGMGRMSFALARAGVRTIGVDLAPGYVAFARRAAAAEGLECRFDVGDALEWIAPEPCDGGVNWFTSFAYSADDATNRRLLERMRDSLRPGARFLLDTLSVPWLLTHFRPSSFRRSTSPATEGLIILDEPEIDFRRGLIRSLWTFVHPDGRRVERRSLLRFLMPHELVALCEQAGFEVIELLGSTDGRLFDRESRRLQVLCARP
ncbi:MAG TPA: methyltransferase domain-containing protein [Phycisphaerales bacterium]|nr:methyltransferase domain-containing protein [Phycisphaerales bacterium]HMP36492.1 methyltransferase domain-containing protein [Phycisphaerales bacterium]